MKDLYERNGLTPDMSEQRIEAVLDGLVDGHPEVQAGRFVLLKPERRRVYDRQHALLHQIGAVRGALGMTKSGHWNGDRFKDFRPPVPKRPSSGAKDTSPSGGTASAPRRSGSGLPLLVVVVVLAIGAPFIASEYEDRQAREEGYEFGPDEGSSASTGSLSGGSAAAPEEPDLPPVPRPANGEIIARSAAPESFELPFTVRTRGGGDYLVKMVDVQNESRQVSFYVHGGSSATVEMPQGTWEMRYASGDTWYGYNHLFGDDTDRTKAEELFPMNVADDGSYRRWTVELIRQRNGNLRTSPIGASEF